MAWSNDVTNSVRLDRFCGVCISSFILSAITGKLASHLAMLAKLALKSRTLIESLAAARAPLADIIWAPNSLSATFLDSVVSP